jgi:hypothetical protein
MPFPISLSDCIPFDSADAANVCRDVARTLEQQRARVVLLEANHIILRVPLVRGFGARWDFVAPLDRIDLAVETSDGRMSLCYRLSSLRTALLSIAIPPVLAFLVGAHDQFLVYFLAIGWLWLVGVNCGVTWIRAKPFFERAVINATSTRTPPEAGVRAPTAT